MEELYNQLINYFNKKDSQYFHLIENNTKEYYMFTVCLKPLSRYKLAFKYFFFFFFLIILSHSIIIIPHF